MPSSFWRSLCCCFNLDDRNGNDPYNRKHQKGYESDSTFFGNSISQGTITSVRSLNTDNTATINNGTHASGIASLIGFYRSKPKSPRELVKALKHDLNRYDAGSESEKDAKLQSKIAAELTKSISALKVITVQSDEDVLKGDYNLQMHLIKEIYENDLLGLLCENLEKFPFEARKDAVIIFNSLLRRQIPPNRQIVAEHICDARQDLLETLLKGYDRLDNTLHYGLMLRECVKYEFLAEIILNMPEFEKLFDYIKLPTFEVSSDAFATFKDLLTKHKGIVTAHLVQNYDGIFCQINQLLVSDNYVTRRQSLKLLGELLHDRRNYEVMVQYVSQVENLKLLMIQLRDKSEKIQYEAFQVFKIFIANPNKPKPIHDILCKNRDRILHFLENFTGGTTTGGPGREDQSLNEDKMFLIEKLQQLPQYPSTTHHQHTAVLSINDSVPMTQQEAESSELDGKDSVCSRSITPESLKDSDSFLSMSCAESKSQLS